MPFIFKLKYILHHISKLRYNIQQTLFIIILAKSRLNI